MDWANSQKASTANTIPTNNLLFPLKPAEVVFIYSSPSSKQAIKAVAIAFAFAEISNDCSLISNFG